MSKRVTPISCLSTLLALTVAPAAVVAAVADNHNEQSIERIKVVGTAEEQIKQALGVSVITADDLLKQPPANDLSELIRMQPGANLTGNSSSGARGNNRQIDLRGMGPENTLILVDGKPVSSRNAVRYGWRGDRDTRGDTNWVPADQIERIEILRGPAAARYGSGAAGGVVNIITKAPAEKQSGSVGIHAVQPEHSAEGATKRATLSLSGPLTETVAYRLYGNLNKSDADDADINSEQAVEGITASGREGVRNKDIRSVISWRPVKTHTFGLETAYSRQGNIYAGDSMNSSGSEYLEGLRTAWLGKETNTLYRTVLALTHNGAWQHGDSVSYIQYESTRNKRLLEGLAGALEGNFNGSEEFGTTRYSSTTVHSEYQLPLKLAGVDQTLTFGAQYSEQKLEDAVSDLALVLPRFAPGIPLRTESTMRITSLFIENNIELTEGTLLTPGLRFDHNGISGSDFSPSLNFSHALTDSLSFRAGIARAYKAPNLYQTNPTYALFSNGNGCWGTAEGEVNPCYLLGNDELSAESSINKEIGIAYNTAELGVSLAYFRNDYRDKIDAGHEIVGELNGYNVFKWQNIPKSLIEGVEGNVRIALADSWLWNTNLTYMLESENKTTGEPLSIIPEYTINTALQWQVSDALSVRLNMTLYGKQVPPRFNYRGNEVEEVEPLATRVREPYSLVGLGLTSRLAADWVLTAGVNNLFDKQLYREGNAVHAGAHTYNEPGRAYYAGVVYSF